MRTKALWPQESQHRWLTTSQPALVRAAIDGSEGLEAQVSSPVGLSVKATQPRGELSSFLGKPLFGEGLRLPVWEGSENFGNFLPAQINWWKA